MTHKYIEIENNNGEWGGGGGDSKQNLSREMCKLRIKGMRIGVFNTMVALTNF